MKEVRTRFAPSPTGYMHIGNLRTALYTYLIAKSQGGKFILRIEDTDQERYVEGAIDVIYNTLKLIGLNHDEGPDIGGDYGPYVQSERRDIYKKYAEELVDRDGAYYCFCSKERLDSLREEVAAKGEVFRYDGHCRRLTNEEVKARINAGEKYVIRQKVPTQGTTTFEDEVYGSITVENSTLEDGILLKSDGLPTYNFANVVDDNLMKITHVIRGSEYLSSSPRYNLLYNAFGWDIPKYIHLPLIVKEGGKKLSKREGDASFEDFYQKGYLKEAIVNYVVLLGWSPGTDEEFFTLDELTRVFSTKGINKSPAVFDEKKLKWMNGEYIRKLSDEVFVEMALPYCRETINSTSVDLEKICMLLKNRIDVLNEIPDHIDFIDELPDYDISMYVHKKMKTTLENSLENLVNIYKTLKDIDEWTEGNIHDEVFKLIEKLRVKNGQVLWPLRTAISGKQSTPGGGIELACILGREETIRRIEIGIDKLKKAVIE